MSAPSTELPVHMRALSLRWLQSQLNEPWMKKKSGDIVKDVVLPATNQRKCSYAATLPSGRTGSATYFISYTWWAQTLDQLIIAILDKLFHGPKMPDGGRDIFLWLDIFAVNQHPGTEQDKDLTHLSDVIQRAEQGTMCCYGREGAPLSRIWCIYEISQTVILRGKDGLHFCFDALSMDFNLHTVFAYVDLEKSQATVAADKSRILSEIEKSKYNKLAVMNFVRNALLEAIPQVLDNFVKHLHTKHEHEATGLLIWYFYLNFLMTGGTDTMTPGADWQASLIQRAKVLQKSRPDKIPTILPWYPRDDEVLYLADMPWFSRVQTTLIDVIEKKLNNDSTIAWPDKQSQRKAVWSRMKQVSPLLSTIARDWDKAAFASSGVLRLVPTSKAKLTEMIKTEQTWKTANKK